MHIHFSIVYQCFLPTKLQNWNNHHLPPLYLHMGLWMLLEDSIIIPSWHCYKCFIGNFSCGLNSGQMFKPSWIPPSVPPVSNASGYPTDSSCYISHLSHFLHPHRQLLIRSFLDSCLRGICKMKIRSQGSSPQNASMAPQRPILRNKSLSACEQDTRS